MSLLEPATLSGSKVKLTPLEQDHHDDLVEAVRDGELWKLWYTTIPSPEQMRVAIDRALSLHAKNRRVEIGATWYRASLQRTALNTESKLLLLSHAFDHNDCIAVEFRTHLLNHQSRRAIERLGARLDGVLRNHVRDGSGALRDTCVYSIISSEWPTVKTHLAWQLIKARAEAANIAKSVDGANG